MDFHNSIMDVFHVPGTYMALMLYILYIGIYNYFNFSAQRYIGRTF